MYPLTFGDFFPCLARNIAGWNIHFIHVDETTLAGIVARLGTVAFSPLPRPDRWNVTGMTTTPFSF